MTVEAEVECKAKSSSHRASVSEHNVICSSLPVFCLANFLWNLLIFVFFIVLRKREYFPTSKFWYLKDIVKAYLNKISKKRWM